MPRWLVRLATTATLVAGSTLAMAFSDGPPPSRTGAPAVGGAAAEPNCTACHSTFPVNTPGATLEILDIPQFYLPDSTYPVRVRLSSTFAGQRRWGFQITAVRESNGQGAGTWDIAGVAGIQIVNGTGGFSTRRYVEHATGGTFAGNVGPVEWTFRWRAPNADQGRIFFFAAGNAANNNGANTGDHIYTMRDTINIHPLLDVPGPVASLDALEPARPNPFRGHTELGFTLSQGGPIDLSVFDAQGRRVTTLYSGDHSAGPGIATWNGRRDDGTMASAGVYFARLVVPGMAPAASRRIVLAR
jgi:FlgD Ig-like domain